jgi:hypothetical protein
MKVWIDYDGWHMTIVDHGDVSMVRSYMPDGYQHFSYLFCNT